jgi:IBR domain, a half RING-finger domain
LIAARGFDIHLTFPAIPDFKLDWDSAENVINLFLEGDLAASTQNKCHLEFKDVATRNDTTMGRIRSQIAKYLGVEDVFSIQLESSNLAAKAKTFKARGTICDRVSAIWDEVLYHDQNSVLEVLQHVKAPWLRVRKAEYLVIAMPDANLESCITPSAIGNVGELRKVAAAILNSVLPRSLRFNVHDRDLPDDRELLSQLHKGGSHKAVITCTQEIHECSICEEDVGYLDWPGRNSTLCEHEGTSCTSCLRNWIGAALDQNVVDKITCPECDKVFENHDLKKHTTDEEFARYERLALRATLNAIPSFRWCIGPNCDSGQIHDAEGGTIFTCTSCKYKSCTTCEREFHEGETCEQYTERMAAQDGLNKASEATIAAMAKECPKCKSKIEKNGGCDHMTCKLI